MTEPLAEPQPWSPDYRRMMKRRIDDAAARAREALGAHDVLMVAWFQDLSQPQFLHCQDGGTAPIPAEEVYHCLAAIVDGLKRQHAGEPDASTVQ